MHIINIINMISTIFLIGFSLFIIIYIISSVASLTQENKNAKAYIKDGGLHQPEVEITEMKSGDYKFKLIGVEHHKNPSSKKLKYESIHMHIGKNEELRNEFEEILKNKIPEFNPYAKSFKSLNEVNKTISSLYEAHQKIIDIHTPKKIITDFKAKCCK